MTRSFKRTTLAALGAGLLLQFSLAAQNVTLTKEAYVKPPREIADVVTAPRHLNVSLRDLGPDGEHFLVPVGAGLPTLQQFGKPFVNLGEMEIDHLANRSRRLTLRRTASIELWNHKTGEKVVVDAPSGSWLSVASAGGRRGRRGGGSASAWSPDGSKVAYLVHNDRETHLYVAEVGSGNGRKISRTPLLATHVTNPVWTPDGNSIVTVVLPDNRASMPQRSAVATEPQVRVSDEGATPTRTYQTLMETPYDSALLEWLSVGQIARIDVANGNVSKIGRPDMYKAIAISPDNEHLLVDVMRKPFSYHVPVSSFGSDQVIWNMQGQQLAEVQSNELQTTTVRLGGGPRGGPRNPGDKRNIAWLPDGSGLSFLQQEPRPEGRRGRASGDDEDEEEGGRSPRKDRIHHWSAPFGDANLEVMYESENRLGGVQYSQDAGTLFITETEDGQQHLFAMRRADPDTRHTITKTRANNIYRDPGSLMTRRGEKGGTVVRISSDGRFVYLSGTKYSRNQLEEAPRPFVNKQEISSGESTPVFESAADVFESVSTAVDDDLTSLITTRQTRYMPADSYVRDVATGDVRKLTSNRDYTPELTRAIRKRFRVERVDGIELWVNLTLPPDYVEGTKLPAMFWFYPREYTDQRSYDRSAARYNKSAFPNIGTRSMATLTKLGYAVVEPDSPIIGKQGQMNNNYVQDLRNNLWAVIDFLDKENYIDRDRLGIGGHSYGAFGTANAMIHTPFFKAGIAGDGNYNRTLTPLTFQSERRLIYDAREVYIQMSPLLWANQLNGALLMYHGIDDANNGTFPINSDRMFHVLNGLGKKTALYEYPYEHHGPATEETLLDLWGRWVEWLDVHVKNAEARQEKQPEPVTSSGQNRN